MRNSSVMPRVTRYYYSISRMSAVVVLLDGAVCVKRVSLDYSWHTAYLYNESCICISSGRRSAAVGSLRRYLDRPFSSLDLCANSKRSK